MAALCQHTYERKEGRKKKLEHEVRSTFQRARPDRSKNTVPRGAHRLFVFPRECPGEKATCPAERNRRGIAAARPCRGSVSRLSARATRTIAPQYVMHTRGSGYNKHVMARADGQVRENREHIKGTHGGRSSRIVRATRTAADRERIPRYRARFGASTSRRREARRYNLCQLIAPSLRTRSSRFTNDFPRVARVRAQSNDASNASTRCRANSLVASLKRATLSRSLTVSVTKILVRCYETTASSLSLNKRTRPNTCYVAPEEHSQHRRTYRDNCVLATGRITLDRRRALALVRSVLRI